MERKEERDVNVGEWRERERETWNDRKRLGGKIEKEREGERDMEREEKKREKERTKI